MGVEGAIPGAYQQVCMGLPERSITLKVRLKSVGHVRCLTDDTQFFAVVL